MGKERQQGAAGTPAGARAAGPACRLLQWALGIAASAAAVIILLISSFELAMYLDFGVYQKEYEKYDVRSDLGMEMDDIMYVTREMMAYLRGDRPKLQVVTVVEGREQDFFNEQDRLHMADVQGLFLGGLRLRAAAAALLAFALAALLVLRLQAGREAGILRVLCRSYQVTVGILAALLSVLGIAVARDFNAVFTKFHEIFFDNDLWIFNPAEDYMIRMLPEGLFFDMVLHIGGYFLAGLLLLLLLSVLGTRRKRA